MVGNVDDQALEREILRPLWKFQLQNEGETALDVAVKSSEEMGVIAAEDGTKAEATHGDFAAKVKLVLDLFPEDLRPKPR